VTFRTKEHHFSYDHSVNDGEITGCIYQRNKASICIVEPRRYPVLLSLYSYVIACGVFEDIFKLLKCGFKKSYILNQLDSCSYRDLTKFISDSHFRYKFMVQNATIKTTADS